ncbi:MAG: hypothetical protein QOG23_1990 [Blastocatellia bacterium]|nr:hypothetical protein [Blastocatellia bacterium]
MERVIPVRLSAEREPVPGKAQLEMSKTIRLIAAALATILPFFAALFLSPASSSQQSPQATTTSARNAAMVAATSEVLKETSEIRQLAILRPVQSSAQSRAEIERMLIKSLDEETTPAQMHAAEVTLKRLGLAPPDFQFRALLLRVLTEQVAGYYDPKTREFHLADWIDLDGQRPVMAHELTHALQDQHFNLRRFDHWPKGDSDAELAAHALIEGDASLAMTLYITNNPLRALAFLKSFKATNMESPELDKAPRAVRENLLFAYLEGINWTTALYKQGGWARVSKAFAELPQSTEQIMHPDKYFAHEAPVKVMMPDITGLLNSVSAQSSEVRGRRSEVGGRRLEVSRFAGNADVSSALSAQREHPVGAGRTPAVGRTGQKSVPLASGDRSTQVGWKRIDYDVQGEWGIYLMLDEFLKSPTDSRRAAAGWGGDRFAVYEGPKGEVLFTSLSSWDTESDARAFFDAYVKRTGLRYQTATRIASTVITQNPATETRQVWKTSEGQIVVELVGSRVLIVEGLPDGLDFRSLLKAME